LVVVVQVEWVDHDQTRTLIVERWVGEEGSGRRDRRDGNAATRHLYQQTVTRENDAKWTLFSLQVLYEE